MIYKVSNSVFIFFPTTVFDHLLFLSSKLIWLYSLFFQSNSEQRTANRLPPSHKQIPRHSIRHQHAFVGQAYSSMIKENKATGREVFQLAFNPDPFF